MRNKLSGVSGVTSVEVLSSRDNQGEFRVHSGAESQVGQSIFQAVAESGWSLSTLEPETRSLEEVYLRLASETTTKAS